MSKTNLPILYSFRRCPYAMRARMALVYSDVKVELREVELRNKPGELISVSPKATVPVLIQSDGTILEESLDIIHWAMSVQDNNGWQNLNLEQQQTADSLIIKNDSEFKQYLDKYKYSQRFPEYSEQYYRQQGELFLTELEELLMSTSCLIKDELTYVDIAIAPFIRQFANVDFDWFTNSKYQNLVQWLDKILKSSIFIVTMHKYPVWNVENEKIIFP